MKRFKVLVSAYACEPGKGSEPGVGWNWVKQIAHTADEVWVITRANNREAIEKALTKEPLSNVHWVYFDLPRWARFWKKGQRGVHLYYYLWQVSIYLLARRLHRQVKFDLVHHVTFGNYWLPSFLALLPVPFIWGPVGGGESAPRAFYGTFSWRGRIYESLRELARWMGEYDPFTRMTARRAAATLSKANETAERLRLLGAKNVQLLSEVAFFITEIAELSSLPPHLSSPFRLISVGRLLHWKGFDLGFRAFARLVQEFPDSEYWIVGDGPERKNLERLARKLSIIDKLFFWGALPRSEALKKLAECDVLVHPSLHDSGGWVCIEAMAAGRAVICLDLGGPALQATDECGFRVRATNPGQVVQDITSAMLKLARNRQLRKTMGEAARERVQKHFSWDQKGEFLNHLYHQIIHQPTAPLVLSDEGLHDIQGFIK
jgi:glycosyltransferase involved in cell wall biosynthesis